MVRAITMLTILSIDSAISPESVLALKNIICIILATVIGVVDTQSETVPK